MLRTKYFKSDCPTKNSEYPYTTVDNRSSSWTAKRSVKATGSSLRYNILRGYYIVNKYINRLELYYLTHKIKYKFRYIEWPELPGLGERNLAKDIS